MNFFLGKLLLVSALVLHGYLQILKLNGSDFVTLYRQQATAHPLVGQYLPATYPFVNEIRLVLGGINVLSVLLVFGNSTLVTFLNILSLVLQTVVYNNPLFATSQAQVESCQLAWLKTGAVVGGLLLLQSARSVSNVAQQKLKKE